MILASSPVGFAPYVKTADDYADAAAYVRRVSPVDWSTPDWHGAECESGGVSRTYWDQYARYTCRRCSAYVEVIEA